MTSLAASASAAVQPGHLWVWLCPDDHRAVPVSSVGDEVGSVEAAGGRQPEETCPTCGGPLLGPYEYLPAMRDGDRIVVRVL